MKVDNFCWKILRLLQKNFMIFGRKFNAFCDSYISMLSPHLYGQMYFLIFIKKKNLRKIKKVSIIIDKSSGIIDYSG